MDERREKQEAVRDELRQLGANLRAAIHEAWESDERRRMHVEIASGLEEAAATLRAAAQDFAASPAGQKLQDEVKALHQRVRTGDAAETIRSDILSALRMLNAELEKAARRKSPPADPGASPGNEP